MNQNYTTVHMFLVALALVMFFLSGLFGPEFGQAPAAGGGWYGRGRGFIGWGLFLWLLSTIFAH